MSQRLAVRSACAKVPEVKAPPVPSDLNSPYALQQLTFRIDHATTSGTFSLDGETHQVDNNLWVVGDNLRIGSSARCSSPAPTQSPPTLFAWQ